MIGYDMSDMPDVSDLCPGGVQWSVRSCAAPLGDVNVCGCPGWRWTHASVPGCSERLRVFCGGSSVARSLVLHPRTHRKTDTASCSRFDSQAVSFLVSELK